MKSYVGGDSLTLQEFRDGSTGLRPSYEEILGLIDTDDPAWPATTALLREMVQAGVSIDKTAFTIAVKLATHRQAMLDAGRGRKRRPAYEKVGLATVTGSIVYYIQRGKLIKIGTTAAPDQRFAALLPDKILAFEPGTAKDEKIRHRQFFHLRRKGEYFTAAPELMEHIRNVRLMYGDPDPAWQTAGSRDEVRRSPSTGSDLPTKPAGELATVAEAVNQLGISEVRLRGWIHRKKISPAGRNEHGHFLYYVEHFIALRDRPYRGGRRPSLTMGSTPV